MALEQLDSTWRSINSCSSKLYTEHVLLQTNLQAVAVIVFDSTTTTICNIYLPLQDTICYNDLYNFIKQLPKPLLTGDFNSHHHLLGSKETNLKGKILLNIIDNFNLLILNTQPTHFSFAYGTWSLLDLLISTPQLSSDFINITFNPPTTGKNLNYRKINWEKFTKIFADINAYSISNTTT